VTAAHRRPELLVHRPIRAAAAALAVLAALGACGDAGSASGPTMVVPGTVGPAVADDPGYADRALAAPFPLLDLALGPRTIADALPSTSWRLGSGPVLRIADVAVTGRFTTWRPGTATVWSATGDVGGGTAVLWDDARAETRTLVMTFAVDRVVAAADGVAPGGAVEVSIGVDARYDAAAVARGLVAAGESIAFLTEPADARTWNLALGGGLVGRVADDGVVTWGVLDAAAEIDASRQPLADAARGVRVAELEAAALTPRTIAVGG